MGRHGLGTVASTRQASVRAYAHCHPTLGVANGTVTLALVNINPNKTVDVQLVAAGSASADHGRSGALRLNSSDRMHYMLTTDSPHSRTVSLNGSPQPLQLDADGQLPTALAWHAGGLPLRIAPLSYGFVDVLLEAGVARARA